MIRALAGWMLVQPLNVHQSANDRLRLGRVHSIGELPDPELQAKIPFTVADRVAWIDGVGQTHVINETLIAVPLSAVLVYEPSGDLVKGDGQPPDDIEDDEPERPTAAE